MIAYKFLRTGRVGPFSEFRWPDPGVWVRVGDNVAACRTGIHACRTQDLPWWLADELWEIELEDEVALEEHKILARAGRLRTRIEGWTAACATQYGQACAWRARDRAAQALRIANHADAAEQLTACTTLDEVRLTARQLAEHLPDTRISLTIARDGAVRALSGAAPTSAYIAAHAAKQLDGPAGYAAERSWQSRWLVERLDLRDNA
ncbi:MAG: hypothetical protein ACLPZR_06195 [Solirubrobacteraceae bacterium]